MPRTFGPPRLLVRPDNVASFIANANDGHHARCFRTLYRIALPIAFVAAFGSPYHIRPNGSALEIRKIEP
jgi:hypothetical protein